MYCKLTLCMNFNVSICDLCALFLMVVIMIKYEKAFALMKEKGLTTYKIRQDKIIGENALTAMRQSKGVSTNTIDRLCKALNCQPGDIMEYVPDPPEEK